MSDSETYSKKKKRKAEEVGTPPKKHKKNKVKKEQFPNEFHEEQNDELRLPGLNCGRSENEKKHKSHKTVPEINKDDPEGNFGSGLAWTEEEMRKLIKNIEDNIPKGDTLTYVKRVERLDWEKIKFEPYTAEDCSTKCKEMFKKIRRHRLLQEMLEDAKDWVKRPWSDFYVKKKPRKHPDMPPRPLTSYLLFFIEKRPKLALRYPHLSTIELTQKLSEKYKLLSTEKKQKYAAKALAKKEDYNEKLKQFREQHPECLPELKQKIQRKVNPITGLTKPLTPFKVFCDTKINKHKDDANFDHKAFLVRCKEQWNKLSDKKKFIWIKWSYEQEAEYMNELKVFCAKNPDYCSSPNDFKSVLKKEEKQLFDKMRGKPEKPPSSAYTLFSVLHLRKNAGDQNNAKLKMKDMAEKWKSMTNLEKQEYNDRLKQMQETYKLEFASYLETLPEEKRKEEIENNMKRTKNTKSKNIQTKIDTVLQPQKKTQVIGDNTLYKGEPAQPPRTTKDYYVQKFMKENNHISVELRATEAYSNWKNLSEKKKKKYEMELAAFKDKYIKDYETFLKKLSERELQEYSTFKNSGRNVVHNDEEDDENEEEENSSEEESSSSQRSRNNVFTQKPPPRSSSEDEDSSN